MSEKRKTGHDLAPPQQRQLLEQMLRKMAGGSKALHDSGDDHSIRKQAANDEGSRPTVPEIELWPSTAEFFVYDKVLYHAMTHDELRNKCYMAAINQLVEGKIVVDIGTGPDVILSRLCVEAGAEQVYAIEYLSETYQAARKTIDRFQLQDKIQLIHGDAKQVNLPVKADVCVSELVGAIGGAEGVAVILNNAWRFLKDGGVMIPSRSTTMIAAISLPERFIKNPKFSMMGEHYTRMIFQQVGYPFDLRLCLKNVSKEHLISTAGIFEDLDFSGAVKIEERHTIDLSMIQDGKLDGFLVWLTLETIKDQRLDILAHEHCWLPIFLPVFCPSLEVLKGDVIRATITRTLCDNGLNPEFGIKGTVERSNTARTDFEYMVHHNKPVVGQTPFYRRLFSDGKFESSLNNREQAH